MKKLLNKSKGFSILEGLLVLIIIVLIGGVGWTVHKHHKKATNNSTTPTSTRPAPTKNPTSTNKTITAGAYAGWKIYSHGGSDSFSVRYPSGYTLDTAAVDNAIDTSQGHLVGVLDIDSWAMKNGHAVSTSTCKFMGDEGIPTCAVKVEIVIYSKVTKNLTDWIRSIQSINPVSSQGITIDGQSAKKNVYKSDSVAGGHFTGYYYRKGDRGVEFSVIPEGTKLTNIAEKIVTSFKLD